VQKEPTNITSYTKYSMRDLNRDVVMSL